MAIANVTLNHTFDEWRSATNQLITFVNEVDSQQLINAVSNTAALTVSSRNIKRNDTLYLTLNVSNSVLDRSTLNVATANAVNIVFAALANTDARLVLVSNDANVINSVANAAFIQANVARVQANAAWTSSNAVNAFVAVVAAAGNNYMIATGVDVGAGANIYARTVSAAANTWANVQTAVANSYAETVGTAGNNYTRTVGSAANAWTNTQISVANSYAVTVGAAGNNYSIAVGAASNVYAETVGTAGNSYARTVGTAGNNFMTTTGVSIGSGANAYAVLVGAAGNSYARTVGTAGNTYSDTVGTAGNNYTRTVGTVGNTYSETVGTAGNNYTRTVGTAGNTYAETVGTAGNNYVRTLGTTSNAFIVLAYTQANTGRFHANVSYEQANTARERANAAYDLAASVSGCTAPIIEANKAGFDTANAAYFQANTGRDIANLAFVQANQSFEQANTVRNLANASMLFMNTTGIHVNTAFAQANTARIHANNAYLQANNALANTSGSSFAGNLQIPTGNLTIGLGTTQGIRLTVNDHVAIANVFPQARFLSGSQYIQLNSNTNFGGWNDIVLDRDISIIFTKGSADDGANLVIAPWSDSTFGYKQDGSGRHGFNTSNPRHALDANGTANISGSLLVSSMNVVPTVQSSFDQANTARTHANNAFLAANTGLGLGAAFAQANTARVHANAAFLTANSALANTAGITTAGSLNVPGTLTANILTVLATNGGNEGSQINLKGAVDPLGSTYDNWAVDIYQNQLRFYTSSTNTNTYYIQNLGTGTVNMLLDGHASIASMNVVPTVQSSFDQANTARTHANNAFLAANTGLGLGAAFAQANTARVHANVSFEQANTARIHANAAFEKANSGATIINTDALNATRYIVFTDKTSGILANANVASALSYNPSSGAFVATSLKSSALYDSSNRQLLIKDSSGTVVWGN